MQSLFGSINLLDIGKGALVAALTVFVGAFGGGLQSGVFPAGPDILVWVKAGLVAGIGYILKNLFTNSQGKTFTAEPK
jgi:hypothetical protein